MKRAFFASVACVGMLAGCSSSSSGTAAANTGPVIDSVQAAATATAGTQWTVTITFHDAEKDAVQDVHLTIKDVGVDQTQAASGSTANASAVVLSVNIPANMPKGVHAWTVSLVDARGAEGAVYANNLTVQ